MLTSPVQTQYQSCVYSAVHSRSSTSPPLNSTVPYRPNNSPKWNPHSLTDPEPVMRILYRPLQTQYQSSVYYNVLFRHSTSPPNKYQSSMHSTAPDRHSNSPSYTLQPTRNPVPYSLQSTTIHVLVFRILSTVHYRPCSSLSYTLQSTTDSVPVFRILYSPVSDLRILYSPLQTPD